MLLAATWFSSGGGLKYVDVCPVSGNYRVEFHELSRFRRLWHANMKRPRIIRLYDNAYNTLVGESAVVDFEGDDGHVAWLMSLSGEVRVGRQVVFRNVPPEPRGAN